MTDTRMKIGTDHADMDYFANQFAIDTTTKPMSDPQCSPIEYFAQVILGDLTVKGMGYQWQDWHWAYLTEAQCETLRGYIGPVNVLIPNHAGAMTEYTGSLVWPLREPEHYNGHVFDITVKVIELVVV